LNLPDPLIEEFAGGIKITLFKSLENVTNVPLNVPLNEKILELIKSNPGIQRKEIALKLNVTDKTISRYVSEMISDKIIERRGSKKTGGYWYINETNP